MPVETATYVSQLSAADPVHTDGLNQADSHLRLIKQTLQATFPNASGPITGNSTQLNQAANANQNPGVHEVAPNGTTASAKVMLDGVAGSGAVTIANTGTNGQPGALSITANDATNANPITALLLSQAGALSTPLSVNSASIQKGGNELLPTGIICMWSGAANAIPGGWALCNGANGTPNLQNCFVLGAGLTYSVGQTGGATSQTPTTTSTGTHSHGGNTGYSPALPMTATTDSQGLHAHGFATGQTTLSTAQLPPHDHGIGGAAVMADNLTGGLFGSGGFAFGTETAQSVGAGGGHDHPISADGSHAHNVTVSDVPAHAHGIPTDGLHTHAVTVSTMPPYYALCFIMKL
jgi:hypothetical protein